MEEIVAVVMVDGMEYLFVEAMVVVIATETRIETEMIRAIGDAEVREEIDPISEEEVTIEIKVDLTIAIKVDLMIAIELPPKRTGGLTNHAMMTGKRDRNRKRTMILLGLVSGEIKHF